MTPDPIREAHRQWAAHGWGEAADGMAMVTSVVRAQQLLMERIDAALRPLDLTFARYEVLQLLAFSRSGSYRAALERFQALAAANPDDIEARIWIARLHALMGDDERAVSVYESIVATHPNHFDALVAGLLIADGRRRHGLPRARLALAGIGSLLFGLSIVLVGVSSAVRGGAGSDPNVAVAARLVALLAGISYLAAFAPPRWVLRLAHRALPRGHSTVTVLARFRGWSTSQPRCTAIW